MNENKDISLQELAELLRTERPNLMRYVCYRLGNTEDAKDVLQDVFLKMHSRIQDNAFASVRDIRGYLFRTLHNLCIKRLATRQKHVEVPLSYSYEAPDLPTMSFEDDFRRISSLLDVIPQEQAEVIRLRIYGDSSFAEIADILNLPVPTVKSRFLYGLQKIKTRINQSNERDK